jgi:hypothetical protein
VVALVTLGATCTSAVVVSSCAATHTARPRTVIPSAAAPIAAPLAKGPAVASKGEVLRLDFNHVPEGPYTEALLRAESPGANSVTSHLPERAHVVREEGGNKVLRVDYPAHSVGPAEGGAVFIVSVPPASEYYLSYRVRLEDGFDFARGGKLPGLSSGGGKYSGGRVPVEGDGWSARLLFKPGGKAGVYLYHAGMKGPWGDTLPLTADYQPGHWHTIVQHVRVNHGDQHDGILEVWLDGVSTLLRHDLELRRGAKGLIDSLCFSTFHGGNDPSFAPTKDSHANFDDFVISETSPL